MIERSGDQEALRREVLAVEPRLDHPEMALMREDDALGHTGRAGGVEEERGLALSGRDGGKGALVEKRLEGILTLAAECDDGQGGAIRAARAIGEDELRARVFDDE